MSESDRRDRPGLTLLVQLFGREVLDRLARAGYDDESAIAAAGPDRLASSSGVSLTLAQRIVAVVQEARGPAEPLRTPSAARRRKGPPGPPTSKRPERRVEAVPARKTPDDGDPFVDDVALVTWMGFTSKTPSGRLSFSVADRILDPIRPDPFVPEDPPSAAATSAAEPRPSPPAQDKAPRRTLPGSFWSFGGPARVHGAPDEETVRPPENETPREAPLPRRVRDDH